jgi:hypothetical protein
VRIEVYPKKKLRILETKSENEKLANESIRRSRRSDPKRKCKRTGELKGSGACRRTGYELEGRARSQRTIGSDEAFDPSSSSGLYTLSNPLFLFGTVVIFFLIARENHSLNLHLTKQHSIYLGFER